MEAALKFNQQVDAVVARSSIRSHRLCKDRLCCYGPTAAVSLSSAQRRGFFTNRPDARARCGLSDGGPIATTRKFLGALIKKFLGDLIKKAFKLFGAHG
jgi:hypothetical protein